ncbi:hypothetical protein IMCC1989_1360 [gamma proteobacterium IMCC1989]|nr:hypothetical protein IMCC1989_1360 [gamma proteobacterium IMCC1989]
MQIERINKHNGKSYYGRFILGEFVFVSIMAPTIAELKNASGKIWE